MTTLSVLCVTRAERRAIPFIKSLGALATVCDAEFVIAADGLDALATLKDEVEGRVVLVRSKGYIESVLDDAVRACDGDYILRLDDDEFPSPDLVQWLRDGSYFDYDHWQFPRMHLWPNRNTFIDDPQLWPDYQTRLSVQAKSGGRRSYRSKSPFGDGRLASVAIEHHKFLVRSYEERRTMAEEHYQGDYLMFLLPEDVKPLHCAAVTEAVPC